MTYILVESNEDKCFIDYLLLNLLDKKSSDYSININGSHGITDSQLTKIEKHLRKDGNNAILINDADTNFNQRQEELHNKVETNSLDVKIFLLPNNTHNGELEDLLVDIGDLL